MKAVIAGLLTCGCVSLADAPLWPPASDYINASVDCRQSDNVERCTSARESWTVTFNDAIAGQYRAQTAVATCLSTGCDGAIRADPMLGCAWRKVALITARREGGEKDATDPTPYCSRPYLDEAGQRAAAAEAEALEQMLSAK